MGQVLPIVFAAAGGVALLLVLLAAWQSVRALLASGSTAGGDGGAAPSGDAARRELLHEKETLLSAIRELRFEHELGKVSDADLQLLEQRYRGRAREVLRLLDEDLAPHREAARALIAKARGAAAEHAAGGASGGGAAVSTQAAVEPAQAPASSLECAACKTHNDEDARFCKRCGATLREEAQP